MMTTNKDNLSKLFQNIELDQPSFGFADNVMSKIEAYAEPNKLSLKTFMSLIVGAAAIVSSFLIIIFKNDVHFFIHRYIKPFFIGLMQYISGIIVEADRITIIMTIVSCVILILAVLQLIANKSKEAARREEYRRIMN